MGNRIFIVFISLILFFGIVVGYELSTLQRLDTSKLINVVGLLYSLLGVIVLSELAAVSERWKRIAVRWVAPTVLWLHTALPLGIFVGGIAASFFLRSTLGAKVSKFAITFFFYSLLPLSVLNETVVFPQLVALRELDSRWRWFAFFLLLSGVSLQLISALMGFGGASS
jgi:hypothetical protein